MLCVCVSVIACDVCECVIRVCVFRMNLCLCVLGVCVECVFCGWVLHVMCVRVFVRVRVRVCVCCVRIPTTLRIVLYKAQFTCGSRPKNSGAQ